MTTMALSSATSSTRPSLPLPSPSSSSSARSLCCGGAVTFPLTRRKPVRIACEVTLTSDSSVTSPSSATPFAADELDEDEARAVSKVGSRVRVKGPLKVYHVPKVPELDVTGKEGVIKQYVVFWKGKRISANLPFKVEFVEEVDGRDKPVKFSVHLREDEFEYLD